MREIDAVADACGLRGFRYVAFAPMKFDDVPIAIAAPAEGMAVAAAPVVVQPELHLVEPPAMLVPVVAASQADLPAPATVRDFSLLHEVLATPYPPTQTPTPLPAAPLHAAPLQPVPRPARRTPRSASRVALSAARRT